MPICDEGEYFDYNMYEHKCQPKRQPGERCQWHLFDADDQCSSGMCGFEHCCSEEAVNSGCDRPCDEYGVCGGDSYPGESCVDHSDCYGDRPCLGGKCCHFDMHSYNSSTYYDPWMNSMYGSSPYEGCTACGGVVWQGDENSNSDPNMYPPGYYGPGYGPGGGRWDHLFHPDNGRCSACAETHVLVTQEDINEQMMAGTYNFYLQPWTCREICDEGEYFDYNMFKCQPKRQPGEWCDRHLLDADNQCSSGMCGYQYCCSQEAAEDGCQNPCDYGTGACSSKSAPGGECSQDSDCYVGLHENSRKCLGGHCCSFDAWQYDNNDPWMGNRYSDCTSCGGVFEPPEFDPNDPYAYMGYRVQNGQCDACEPGKRLITIEDNFIRGMHVGGYEVGTCAPVCAEDEYLTHQYTCETKTLPGGACWGESRMCTSGLCGSPHCCSDAAAEVQDDDTDNPQCCMQCDANGECVHRGDCWMIGYDMYAGAGTFPGDYSGAVTLPDSLPIVYPGTSGCQLTCEGHGHDEATCRGIRGCVYKVEDGLCWSAVGSEPCPPSMKEVEEQAKKRAEEKRAAANEKRREADELELVLQEKERELEAAEEALDAAGETLVASVSDPRLREKLGVLSDCAKSENDVPIVNIPSIAAASGDAACDEAWQSANCARCEANGFCEWSSNATTTTGRRRRLLVSEYDASLGFNPDRVDESDLTEAMNALSASGFTASRTTVDPVSALRDTDGVSSSAVESFAASVTAARTARNEVASAESAFDAADRAAADAEAAADDAEDTANKIAERNRPTTSPQTPPPPPSPPPRALVFDDESTAEPVPRQSRVLLVAVAAVLALARR